MLEFYRFAHLSELGVIAILFPAFFIVAESLDVALGIRANPYGAPGRRYHKFADTGEDLRIGDGAVAAIPIVEAFAGSPPFDAALIHTGIGQPNGLCGLLGLDNAVDLRLNGHC